MFVLFIFVPGFVFVGLGFETVLRDPVHHSCLLSFNLIHNPIMLIVLYPETHLSLHDGVALIFVEILILVEIFSNN